jgi:hypothetical protein
MTEQESMEKVVERIQKLLNLAAKNPNEAEAAAAASKAQELLTRYNLDVATVENESGRDGKREQAAVDGGFLQHQRDLWKSVAQLNFCFHWTQRQWVDVPGKKWGYRDGKYVRRHVVVGRTVNVKTTQAMASYLQNVVERLTRERIKGTEISRLSNWAVSYRKGITKRIIEKVEDRREKLLAAEAADLRRRQHAAAREGTSTATALTVALHAQNEHAANYDFLYGEGAWASIQADRAERARRRREEHEAYTKWAKENPEEAKAKREEEEAREKRNASRRTGRRRWGGGERDGTDYSAYYSGYDDAKDVSIDQQVDGSAKVVGRLR